MTEYYNDEYNEIYKKDDKYHRVNGPAITWHILKVSAWYLNGHSHRYYGSNLTSDWFLHGKRVK